MNLLLLVFIALLVLWYYLRREGFTTNHASGIVLGMAWAFFFFTYGGPFLQKTFPSLHAASFFFVYFLLIIVGGGLLTALPLWNAGERSQARKVFMAIVAIGLLYVAVDAISLGPAAVGPNSPYQGESLCSLNPTYYAEDVFFGCYIIQPLGVLPYSPMASFLTYIVFPILLLLVALRVIGVRKAERIIFNGQ